MRSYLLLAVTAAGVWAQTPATPPPTAPPPITPETEVARIDGKPITMGEVREFIESAPPQLAQVMNQNPSEALMAMYLTHYLAAEAERLKLPEQEPWKDQLKSAREQVLTTAMATWERNNWSPPSGAVEDYYKRNQLKYRQVKIKAIKIDFLAAPAAAKGTSQKDLEDAARAAFESAHPQSSRTDAQAWALAGDIVKQARGGADFAKLAEKYSDDAASRKEGGDFGSVTANSSFPAEIKKAVFALKANQVSDPIRVASSYYVIRAEEISTQPLNDVRSDILQMMRQNHMGDYLNGLRERFKPTIERPDAFKTPAPAKH